MSLYILSFIALTVQSQDIHASKEKLQYQIDAAIKYMCTNQYDTGEFLNEAILHKDSIKVDRKHNNMIQQSGGLYAVAMYYRLHHNEQNDIDQGFALTECIRNSIQYLRNMSVIIEFSNNSSDSFALVNGATGATALALLGMIEICVAHEHICEIYSHEFILWLHGLITMRQQIYSKNDGILTHGAFAKNVKHPSEANVFYDSESYLAFSRMLQYKKHLLSIIHPHDTLWDTMSNIVDGLDEYYMKYASHHDAYAHWLLQSWFSRWIVLNHNDNVKMNHFMNHYMVSVLMKHELEGVMIPRADIAQCYLMEAVTDVIYAVQQTIDASQYKMNASDALYVFKQSLYELLDKRYRFMTERQLFHDSVDFYFESKFDGGFVGDKMRANDKLKIDNTQYCAIALMKIHSLLFMSDTASSSYSYTDYNNVLFDDNKLIGANGVTNYDVMMSAICLVVLIIFVNCVFFYWCYYYPKEQKQRNDLFWMGQTMESAPSDAVQYNSDFVI